MTGESTAGSRDGRGGVIDPYEPEEILDVFKARWDLAEPYTAQQIADRNGRSRSATLKHAKKLAAEGVLRTKKTGNSVRSGRVFWIPLDAGLFERGESHQ
jgi:hypothetical protein